MPIEFSGDSVRVEAELPAGIAATLRQYVLE